MTDISRRNLLKGAAAMPLLPLLSFEKNEDNIQEVYKLVFNGDGKNSILYSVLSKYSKYTIFYKTNIWIYPKIGRLFGFDTFKNAKQKYTYTQIYRCLAKDVTYQEYMSCSDDSDIEKFWNSKDPSYKIPTPKGTVSFSAVKLIERVR